MLAPDPAAIDDEPEAPPAVEVRRRTPLTSPVIFASPHSGRHYPASLLAASRLSARDLRSSEDAWVDALIAPAEGAGVSLVLAGWARAWTDLNRGPRELDPLMFDSPPANAPETRSARVAAGLGFIPRIVGPGREIYRDRLDAGEAERRLNATWKPYHRALEALIAETRQQQGYAILVDWHSMPASAARPEQVRGGRAPDVVLGDRHGSSCSALLTARVQAAFEAMGYRVARNSPYAGGWTTERYGQPDEGVHALQVELSRALYVNEATLERTAGFTRVRRDIATVAANLTDAALGL